MTAELLERELEEKRIMAMTADEMAAEDRQKFVNRFIEVIPSYAAYKEDELGDMFDDYTCVCLDIVCTLHELSGKVKAAELSTHGEHN